MIKIKRVSCALLVNNQRQLLIQDRKDISKYWEEWSFFGGGIEEGENSYDALLREMKEELNIDVSGWNIIPWGEVIHTLENFWLEYHRYLFYVEIPNDVTVFQDYEWSGAYFFSLNDLATLRFNTDISQEIDFLKKVTLDKIS